MFKLSRKSKERLRGVHPDLIRVVERAIEIAPLDFGVSCGIRTDAEQYTAVKSGASTTMKSKHLVQPDTWGHAVDLFVLVDGEVTWEHKHFRKVVQSMFTAAIELGVQIEAGALWRDFVDSPHFQLSSKYYG
jgi:peptidoglycan L-alanyl-D-glutamate endopeptidase CwlK